MLRLDWTVQFEFRHAFLISDRPAALVGSESKLSGFLERGNSLGTTGHLLSGDEGGLGLAPAIYFRLWLFNVHFFTMFSEGAVTAARAPAPCQGRGIRSMCLVARTDSRRSPVSRRPTSRISVCGRSRSFLSFVRLDRIFDFRTARCPLDRAQDASIRFVGEQSQ
jgi:hypothetical protein